jgi:hypothetical protein
MQHYRPLQAVFLPLAPERGRVNPEYRSRFIQVFILARHFNSRCNFLERAGAEPIPGAPERLGALIEADLNGWKKLIADAKLQLD